MELRLSRILNAPRELVWEAWTDQKQLTNWWGPHHFTIPVCELDVKPCGKILIQMQGPDGTIYPMNGFYKELIKPEKIVFVSVALDPKGNYLFEQTSTILFETEGEKTKLSIHVTFDKLQPNAALYLSGAETGWNQMLDKLLITYSW